MIAERVRVCQGCTRTFEPKDGRQKYHSPGCANRARVRRCRAAEAPWEPPLLTQEIDDAVAMTHCAEYALLAVIVRLNRLEVAA
jgi:predicted RNA-binding Zn-ribbon protein involved in translation (DUF1610 family)